jgi:hypothetical protein
LSFNNGTPELAMPIKMKQSYEEEIKEQAKCTNKIEEKQKEYYLEKSDDIDVGLSQRLQTPSARHNIKNHDTFVIPKRSSTFRRDGKDGRMHDDRVPEKQELEYDKKHLKSKFRFAPECDEFEISYVPSQKCIKKYLLKFNIYRKNRVFRCKFSGCDMTFVKAWTLFDHLRTHTGEKPFI